jgi:hypothetical protein
MTLEAAAPPSTPLAHDVVPRFVQWTPIIVGALAATALSSILVTFGATVGLGVTSTAPTWRDASVSLWLLSGIYLIMQAIISFGVGGYIAGRLHAPLTPGAADEVELTDGVHGLAAWALAVVLGAGLAGLLASATLSRAAPAVPANYSAAAEPLLSYELDRLFRAGRKAPTADLASERAEAGRILLTTSGYNGMSTEDRAYLIQQVAGTTGLNATDAERRVDTATSNSLAAIKRSRRSTVILAFSLATALLLGAVAAWAAASAGGHHRDGGRLPEWVNRSNRYHRRTVLP